MVVTTIAGLLLPNGMMMDMVHFGLLRIGMMVGELVILTQKNTWKYLNKAKAPSAEETLGLSFSCVSVSEAGTDIYRACSCFVLFIFRHCNRKIACKRDFIVSISVITKEELL
jgi:hypothetical protein